MEKEVKQASAEQQHIADLLFSLTDRPFVPAAPKRNSSYLSLDVGKGPNKNAVTVSRGHVSFMVKDFAIQEFAALRGLATNQSEKRNSKRLDTRLQFPGLATATISEHRDFFRDMLEAAYKESKDRQEH